MQWLLTLGLLLGDPGAQDAGESQRPLNVVWLVVEDMSPWIACYGDTTVQTPNLDAFAAESVRYTAAFATSPVCAPARSSLITGLHATRIGSMHMRTGNPSSAALEADPAAYDDIPTYEAVPPVGARCFPELLRSTGRYCTNAAKTDYQFRAPATVWDASRGGAHWRDRPEGAPFFAVFNFSGTHESQAFPDARRRPSVIAPEDVSVPPLYPDTPAVRDALARTYDNIAAMDAWVGARLDELAEAGLADETVVFFFSDHGVGLPRGKRSPYDLGTRVPLLVRLPGEEGRTEGRVVSFVDFGPTVLSLAGIDPVGVLDGVPFLGPYARAGDGLAFAHADRFDAVYDRARSVTDGRFRLVRNYLTELPHLIDNAYARRLPMRGDLEARRGDVPTSEEQWQVVSDSRPVEELYDSATDPWETHDRIDDPALAEVRLRLTRALDGWIEATGDLGLVLPERRMVEERLWRGEIQPVTATPRLVRQEGGWAIECTTEGASLGWRVAEDDPWRVFDRPFVPPEVESIELYAHRIGFEPAAVRVALTSRTPDDR